MPLPTGARLGILFVESHTGGIGGYVFSKSGSIDDSDSRQYRSLVFDSEESVSSDWHDPVVEIYSNVISPGVCCSAAAYDLANRRWYKLNIGDVPLPGVAWHHDTRLDKVPDDEWLCSTLEKHIKAYHNLTATPPPWNTINTNSSRSPVTFKLSKEALVRRPIRDRFSYGRLPSDKLPTTTFDQLRDKTYLTRGVDYCLWNDRKCVFKRIEFDCDVESHENEIRTREAILQCIERDPGGASDNHSQEMESRFNVVPILAVVLHDETSTWILSRRDGGGSKDGGGSEDGARANDDGYEIAGFVMPYAGRNLDQLGPTALNPAALEYMPSSLPATGSLSATTDIPVSGEQLLDLARGIRNLSKCGVSHGDICPWNVILTQRESGAGKLLLIDMGDVAPDYQGDADALAGLFLWCLERTTAPALKADSRNRNMIITAAALLKEGDFDRAIGIVSPTNSDRGVKRSRSAIDDPVKRRRVETEQPHGR